MLRTLTGDDVGDALAARTWLGSGARQRTASVNYSGAHADVARGFLHESHSVRSPLTTGGAKAYTRHFVRCGRVRYSRSPYSRAVLNFLLPASTPWSSQSSQSAFYRTRVRDSMALTFWVLLLTYMTNRFAGQIEADAPLALATTEVK